MSTLPYQQPSQPSGAAITSRTCEGCHKTFTLSGYSKHISQTHKPACVAVREKMAKDLLPPVQPELAGRLPIADVNMDAQPVPFQGDFFGDYLPEDFPDEAPPSSVPSGSDSDDESADEEGPVRSHWEPPAIIATSLSPHPPSGEMSNASPQVSGPSLPSREQRRAAEDTARHRKTFVVHFPSQAAGAPITNSPESISRMGTYENYQANISERSADNPYAPFASKMDWEIARWAKTRGSGSTAFTDLLAIEDVSTFQCSP